MHRCDDGQVMQLSTRLLINVTLKNDRCLLLLGVKAEGGLDIKRDGVGLEERRRGNKN